MSKLLDNIEGWVQSGPMGNDLMGGFLGLSGRYRGDDDLKGWDYHKDDMIAEGKAAGMKWVGQQGWGNQSKDPYGLSEKLQDIGATDFGFDPTSFESIGTALAKKSFSEGLDSNISQDDMSGDVWDYGEDTTHGTGNFSQRHRTLDSGDINEYWNQWQGDTDMDIYTNQAKASGLTETELGQLSATDKRWTSMENPLIADATDEYRGGINQIMSNLGGLRTGSAAKRRKDLTSDFSKNILGIRSKSSAARGKHADTLVSRIAKLFA